MIDLHTHTTASDGRCTPAELAARAAAGGVRVLSVTDHDTVAGCAAAADACARHGIDFVTGIEVTAIADGTDVHVLGYFLDPGFEPLLAFLGDQRRLRLRRIADIIDRLAECGIQLDSEAILQPGLADSSRAVGRPAIARALVTAGHVADSNEAFAKWLARGRPAFVARPGAAPVEVIERIHEAGGLVSLAHPGLLARDHWVPAFASAGLDALEVYHSKHGPDDTTRYLAMAKDLGLAVTGGSDFHGDPVHGGEPGSVSLPDADYVRLNGLRATRRASASGSVTSSANSTSSPTK